MATARHTVATIIAHHYIATAAQVEQLANERHTSSTLAVKSDETYLRILLAAAQAKLGKSKPRRKPTTDTQLGVLGQVSAPLYEAVLRGITTDDVAHSDNLEPDESKRRSLVRNSRSGFARSSKSTLKTFITKGGNLRSLDVATVTKRAIRAVFKPAEPVDRVERQVARAQGALLRALARQAKGKPGAAQDAAGRAVDAIQLSLEQMVPAKVPTVIPTRRSTDGAGMTTQ